MSTVNPRFDPTLAADPGPGTPRNTIGEVIAAKDAAEADEAAKKDAAAAADQAYSDSIGVNDAIGGELKTGLAQVGDVFMPDAAGDGIRVFVHDGSDVGFHVIRPLPASTPLPVPAPAPAPALEPAPPAPEPAAPPEPGTV
jgi:hypothetical protein